MLKRILLVVLFAGLSSVAWSQDFGLDLGCCSDPLTGTPISVNGNQGGVHDYFNSTDLLITELSFQINVGTGLSASQFHCISFNFFQNCDVLYNPDNPTLTFDFHGVNPSDGDELFGFRDPETGAEFEGLPTLMDGCQTHPDSGNSNVLPDIVGGTLGTSPCTSRGHFVVSFNTFGPGNTFNGDPGGSGTWAAGTSATLVTVNNQSVPEPSSLVWTLIGLLVVGGFTRRHARQDR